MKYNLLFILIGINTITLSLITYTLIVDFVLFRLLLLLGVSIIAFTTIRSEYIKFRRDSIDKM